MNPNRLKNQIRTLESVFEIVHEKWQAGRPVDRELSALFRRNRQYGSKDRRLISNAIFGYYRWYGWLKDFTPEEPLLALLLGYLLDGNPVDERIEYWADLENNKEYQIDLDIFRKAELLEEKQILFSEAIAPVSIEGLNPELAQGWDISRIRAFQTRPSVWLRLEKSDPKSFFTFLTQKDIAYRAHKRNSKAIEILSPFNIHQAVDFRDGWVEVQDLSSQAVGLICQPQPKSVWWDVCAGSGGKSLHLSALMENTGAVYATDTNNGMIQEMNRRVHKNKRWANIHSSLWDGVQIPDFGRQFDGVLIDAPCSCSGTWRRNPELRWRISKEQVLAYVDIQINLLCLCCDSIRDGGVLVYATCSLFQEENENVTKRFLELHPEFRPVPIKNPFSGEHSEKGLVISPPETDGNGMYVMKMQRAPGISEAG